MSICVQFGACVNTIFISHLLSLPAGGLSCLGSGFTHWDLAHIGTWLATSSLIPWMTPWFLFGSWGCSKVLDNLWKDIDSGWLHPFRSTAHTPLPTGASDLDPRFSVLPWKREAIFFYFYFYPCHCHNFQVVLLIYFPQNCWCELPKSHIWSC